MCFLFLKLGVLLSLFKKRVFWFFLKNEKTWALRRKHKKWKKTQNAKCKIWKKWSRNGMIFCATQKRTFFYFFFEAGGYGITFTSFWPFFTPLFFRSRGLSDGFFLRSILVIFFYKKKIKKIKPQNGKVQKKSKK